MSDIAGKICIVTGGGSGIGRALCKELANSGGYVVVADINGETARQTAQEIVARGCRAENQALDVTDFTAVERLVEETVDRHGRLDLIFNNAGLGIWGDARAFTHEQWRRIFEVNYWGVVNGALAAYAVMSKQAHGHIINVASLAGLVPAPSVTPYAASKHAVVGFSTSLGPEAEAFGVRVTVVCPGPIASGFYDALLRPKGSRNGPRAPADAVSCQEAARKIMRGVERNHRVVVFPHRARRMWLLWRLAPWHIGRVSRATVGRLRSMLDGSSTS